MQVEMVVPPTTNFLRVKLYIDIIDYLWKIIEIGEHDKIDHKEKLIGNISQSILLKDIDSYFYKSVCVPLVRYFREKNSIGKDPCDNTTILKPNSQLILKDMWVNYQYKTEFNPYHDHDGVYSFAIWLKIPYDWKEQNKLPQFDGIKEQDKKAGSFEFEYVDTLGGIRNLGVKLCKEMEGNMLFFPATLRHCVYPFYKTDGPRISIAGNLMFQPV